MEAIHEVADLELILPEWLKGKSWLLVNEPTLVPVLVAGFFKCLGCCIEWELRRGVKNKYFAEMVRNPGADLCRVGQMTRPSQNEMGRGISNFKSRDSTGHVHVIERKGKSDGVRVGPVEASKRNFSWAEKGKWVDTLGGKRMGKRRVKKIGNEGAATKYHCCPIDECLKEKVGSPL